MAQMGDSDFSVPAVQGTDINDSTIIEGSQQEVDDKGNVRFHYTLPDGSPLESDWVQPDFAKKARLGWVDAVRQAIVSQAQHASDKAMQVARERMMNETRLDIPASDVRSGRDADISAANNGGNIHPITVEPPRDPVSFAKESLVRASQEALKWGEVEAEASTKKNAAETASRRWNKVLEMLREE